MRAGQPLPAASLIANCARPVDESVRSALTGARAIVTGAAVPERDGATGCAW